MKYLVGTLCGGLMESPDYCFEGPYQIVEAESDAAAVEFYNEINHCAFFYGAIIGVEFNGVFLIKTRYMSISQFESVLKEVGIDTNEEEVRANVIRAEIKTSSLLTEAFESGKTSDEMKKIVADFLVKLSTSGDKKVLYHQMVSYEDTNYKELDRDKFRLLDVKLKRTDEGMEFVGPYGKPFMVEFEV